MFHFLSILMVPVRVADILICEWMELPLVAVIATKSTQEVFSSTRLEHLCFGGHPWVAAFVLF